MILSMSYWSTGYNAFLLYALSRDLDTVLMPKSLRLF